MSLIDISTWINLHAFVNLSISIRKNEEGGQVKGSDVSITHIFIVIV